MIGSLWFNSFSAGGGGSAAAYELISTTVLGSASATVTFDVTGLSSTYKHLQIRAVQQNTSSSTDLNLRFNADSGSNYPWHYLVGNGSNPVISGAGGLPDNRIRIGSSTDSSTSAIFSANITDILDAFSTSKNKTVRSLCSAKSSEVQLFSGVWLSTSLVTSIVVSSPSGSMNTGSRFSLYGLRG